MAKTIWYISKYVIPRQAGRVGARGFSILRELARMDYHCVIFCSNSNHLAETPTFETRTFFEVVDGVEVNWIGTRKYKGANSPTRILSWFDFEWRLWRMPKVGLARPDVVIVSSLSLLTVINGLWLRWRYRCKLVFEVRDIWPLSLQELRQWSRWHPVIMALGIIEWFGYRFSDVIVGTMPNLGEHVRKVLGYSRPVGCVPQGVDEELLGAPPALDALFDKTHMPKDKFVVVYAGSIGIANALEEFFIVARQMQERKDVHFLILGEGYLKAKYKAQNADLLNLSFIPAVPKVKVQSVLSLCDLMYVSSSDTKLLRFGQSLNKLIDYMLSGKPIVASYSGYPSMLNEAGCGSFVPSGDAKALHVEIERYVDMPAPERLAMGQAGRRWVLNNRKFSTLAEHYIALIEGPLK